MSERAGREVWQLNPRARLRRTSGGGAVFLPETVTTIELDAEAFTAVSLLSQPGNARDLRRWLMADGRRNFTLAEVDILLRELAEQKVLIEKGLAEVESSNRGLPGKQTVPESIHLQLNNTCNLRCPSCYVALCQEDAGALPLERIRALIEEWAAMGVFLLALGGGEALMSPKLASVARFARQRGLVPNVTSNGWLITEALLDEVQGSLGELRISLNDGLTINLSMVEAKVALLRARGMRFGVNLIVTRHNLERLPELLPWACGLGAATINLIRPKPALGNEPWYQENMLPAAGAARLEVILKELEPVLAQAAVTVDCAFSFLFYGQPAGELLGRGVAGCAMGERFAAVKWNGDVYPCSHLHGEAFKAGNVMSASFQDVWERSRVFSRVRRELSGVGGICGRCAQHVLCKGCRAVMWQQKGDWLAGDEGCLRGEVTPKSSVQTEF